MTADLKIQHRKQFILANLARPEIVFYYAVWIFHSVAAFVVAWNASQRLSPLIHVWIKRSDYHQSYHFDNSEPEWKLYRTAIQPIVIAFFFHSCIFTQLKRLPVEYQRYTSVILWVLIGIYLTSFHCVAIFLLFSIIVIGFAIYSRNQLSAWFLCILFVLQANNYAYFTASPTVYYREFNFYLYGAIKVLNFSIFLCRNPSRNISKDVLLRCGQYFFYPPYNTLLIVLYEDFDLQMSNLEKANNADAITYKRLTYRFFRLVLWYFAYEFLLHFIYVNFLFEGNAALLNSLGTYEVASVAYVQGQMFYVKYVVMFGIPSWFALFDGMTPPGPPICISRVSRYSRMWRSFDRGLYQFLKNQVYIPLGGQKNAKNFQIRQFFAMVAAFLFILAWHGTGSTYVRWVTLSGIELCIERIGSAINQMDLWWKFSATIGLRNQRRLIAIAMNATVIPGIFGVFFFLGRQGIGSTVFRRVLLDGIKDFQSLNIAIKPYPTAGFVLLHLLLLGYCFNNVCLQLDESLQTDSKQKPKNE